MNFLKNLKEKSSIFAEKLTEEYYKITRENEEIAKKQQEEEMSLLFLS